MTTRYHALHGRNITSNLLQPKVDQHANKGTVQTLLISISPPHRPLMTNSALKTNCLLYIHHCFSMAVPTLTNLWRSANHLLKGWDSQSISSWNMLVFSTALYNKWTKNRSYMGGLWPKKYCKLLLLSAKHSLKFFHIKILGHFKWTKVFNSVRYVKHKPCIDWGNST